MRKILLIAAILSVLIFGSAGAAYAANVSFNNVGELGLGVNYLSDVSVDSIGYVIGTGNNVSPSVCGCYISFGQNIESNTNSTVVFVSFRASDGTELGYCAALVPAGTTLTNGVVYEMPLATGSENDYNINPTQVYQIRVTVAGNSSYNFSGNGTGTYYGQSTSPAPTLMPGVNNGNNYAIPAPG